MDIPPPVPPTNSQPQYSPNLTPPPPTPLVAPPIYQQPYVQSPKPKSNLKKIFLIIGLLILLGVVGFGYLIFQGVKDAPRVGEKVTMFLEYASNDDLEGAYATTSTEFMKTTTKEDFVRAMSVFKAQYTGFKEQKQTGFSVETNTGKPTQYKYSGIITYTDGDKGEVTAVLVKENEVWKVYGISVNVTVERLEKFQQDNKNSVLGVSTP